jgi:hypothetical protein
MTLPADPPPPKGMAMIAAYRAERLQRRPLLRTGLRQGRIALRQGREARHPAAEPPADAAPPPPAPEPAAAATGLVASVFAGLVSLAVAERENEAAGSIAAAAPEPAPAETAAPEPAAQEPAAPEPAAPETMIPQAVTLPQAAAPEATVAAPPDEPADPPAELPADPPLAEIGFGQGMLIRLSQLGLHTIGDLARADPAGLRLALGDISRLVDVETWINNARQSITARG